MQEKPPNNRGTAEALMQDSGDRKKKKGFAGEEAFLAPTSRIESRTEAFRLSLSELTMPE